MNNPNNLFNMMQTGGLTSTAGGTALARALQRQSDVKKLERQQRAEARRQKRGGLFGSIGSLAGGLLGAAIPGLGTVIGAGLGTALGKRVGEGLGAGKSKQYDRSGTVFGQQAFRDVEQASRDYTRGMGERALVSGLKAALTAGFSKDGGIYGAKNPLRDPLREGSPFRKGYLARMYGIGGDKYASDVTEQALADNPLLRLENIGEDVYDVIDGVPYKISFENSPEGELVPIDIMGGSLYKGRSKSYDKLIPNPKDVLDISTSSINKVSQPPLTKSNLIGKTFSKIKDYGGLLQNLGLARMYGIGGKSFAEDVTRQGILDNAGLLLGDPIDPYLEFYETGETSEPNTSAPLIESSFSPPSISQAPVSSGSSLIGYNQPILENFQDGGYTAKAILQEAGFAPSEKQLGMFKQFDPGEIERAKERTEQSLLSMTGGMGLSSMGGGFGARQRAATSAIGAGQDLIGETAEQAQRDFESQTLGTMADLVTQEVEFDKDYSYRTNVPTDNPSWSPPPMPSEGATYNFGGQNYIYNGNEWVTEYVYAEDIRAQYDDGNDGYGGS